MPSAPIAITSAALRAADTAAVQTQVRAILAKTGTTNLRDFERLLAAMPG